MRTGGRTSVLCIAVVAAGLIFAGCGGGGGNGNNPQPPPAPSDMTWTLRDLGTFGGETSEAIAINEGGRVVGGSRTAANDAHAFRWTNPPADLGTLSGAGHSVANDINHDGVIVGWSWVSGSDTTRHAVVWDNGISDLFPTTGATAFGINDAGHVVGQRGTHAFVWNGTQATDLGTLGGGDSRAMDINEAGTVVGWSKLADDTTDRAFVHTGGALTDIGTLGGPGSRAYAINNAGVITGDSQLSGAGDWSASHGFIREGAAMFDIGTLGGARSHAHSINDEGAVVGESLLPDGTTYHAFIWMDGEMTDLNDNLAPAYADWTITAARDINNSRQIAAIATNDEGNAHAVRLTPQ